MSLTEPLRPESASGFVQVLCINMFLRPPFIHNNLGDLKDARTQYFCEHILPYYDIVCLQEVFGTLNSRKTQIVKAGRGLGLKYMAESPSPSFFSSPLLDGGLVIMSRFPIVNWEFRPYGFGVFPDTLAEKGVLYCEIQVKGESLHLFTTHTQSFYTTSDETLHRLYRTVTRRQIQILAEFMNAKKGQTGLMMLAGDLNVDALEYKKESMFPAEDMDEYQALTANLQVLQPREVLKEIYDTHPVTHGRKRQDGQPDETVLTHQEDQGQEHCIDYIFTVNESTSVLSP